MLLILLLKVFGFVSGSGFVLKGFPENPVLQNSSHSIQYAQAIADNRVVFSLDIIFIMCWIIAWIGIAALVRSRNKLLGNLTLIIGLIAPLLDLIETEMLWTLLLNGKNNEFMTVLWSIISQLSYLITFAAGTVAAISIWSQKPLDRITFVMGTVLVVPAVLGMYIDELFFITNLWYIGWFGCNCLLLWQ